MDKSGAVFRFGPYELRPLARELYKHGVKVRLRPQPFQVLHVLVEHPGEVVTREELRKQLWPSDTFVDFEHGLNTSVKELRGVLGDSATEPRYVETLPRLGYRIIVPVEVAAPPPVKLTVGFALMVTVIGEPGMKLTMLAICQPSNTALTRRLGITRLNLGTS